MKSVKFVAMCAFVLFLFQPIHVQAAHSSGWVWPTPNHSIQRDYPYYSKGGYHGGTDFAVGEWTPVYSSCDGMVVIAEAKKNASGQYISYGNYVKIRATVNDSIVYIRYCHLNRYVVRSGDVVKAGDLIGYSGKTGNATGPHLHYEVRRADDVYRSGNLDPKDYLPGTKYTFKKNQGSNSPIGKVDFIQGGTGRVRVAGWAFDPDDHNEQLNIHVYVGGPAGSGAEVHGIRANQRRTDVGQIIPGLGDHHGFDSWIDTGRTGKQEIYVYAINIKEGINVLLYNRTVTIEKKASSPSGELDEVQGGDRKIYVSGWVLDTDDYNREVKVHVYIGGPAGAGGKCYKILEANKRRADVGAKYPGAGDYHGFDAWIPTDLVGKQKIYVYAIGVNGASNTLLTPRSVEITNAQTKGILEGVQGKRKCVRVYGWAFGKNTAKASEIHVYIGGPAGAGGRCSAIFKANRKRTDVNKVHKCGNYHGFDAKIRTNRTGRQSVYVYAINTSGNGNVLLGNKTVTISR